MYERDVVSDNGEYMGDRYNISVDIGEGSDFAVLHLIEYNFGKICKITSYRM